AAGRYRVVQAGTPVTPAPRRGGAPVAELGGGTVVGVAEVRLAGGVVWARLEEPAGWIPLFEPRTGRSWAVKQAASAPPARPPLPDAAPAAPPPAPPEAPAAKPQAAPEAAVETFAFARVGTVRQGLAAPSTRGRVELAPWLVAPQGAGGGAGGRAAGSAGSEGQRGDCGVFATRSPHRPNPVGLTVCKLDGIDHARGVLFLSGIDVVDGSAVLDIKPYHPVDSLRPAPPPGEAGGRDWWPCTFPSWLPLPTPTIAAVCWRDSALAQLESLREHCAFYPDGRDQGALPGGGDVPLTAPAQALRRAVDEVLGLDPRTPQSRRRGKDAGAETKHCYWAIDVDALSVAFRLVGGGGQGDSRPLFEVVSVGRRGAGGAGSGSKAWLE
ncbi:unnamed protein product, partial [Prorocentrum cordatum]